MRESRRSWRSLASLRARPWSLGRRSAASASSQSSERSPPRTPLSRCCTAGTTAACRGAPSGRLTTARRRSSRGSPCPLSWAGSWVARRSRPALREQSLLAPAPAAPWAPLRLGRLRPQKVRRAVLRAVWQPSPLAALHRTPRAAWSFRHYRPTGACRTCASSAASTARQRRRAAWARAASAWPLARRAPRGVPLGRWTACRCPALAALPHVAFGASSWTSRMLQAPARQARWRERQQPVVRNPPPFSLYTWTSCIPQPGRRRLPTAKSICATCRWKTAQRASSGTG
mmetsp:Transcript_135778/g.378389  ORF Transcript_135778/g.378389 Transcript_135778/m.378389 type:complete len:287 (-) Transcript_135778:1231-2091(-)